MASIPGLTRFNQFRARWRNLLQRVDSLEKQLKRSQDLVDLLIADPIFRPGPELGMNGQQNRKKIVEEIGAHFRPELAVETGTHYGHTTGYLASALKIPVISSEISDRNHHIARRFLRELPNVELRLEDSRALLRSLACNPVFTTKRTLFYLDAHWYDDLPLLDELDIIGSAWPSFIAIIDDFEVPQEPEYGCDEYDSNRRLNLDLISACLQKHRLQAWFPRLPARQETGERRGCCIVAPEPDSESIEWARSLTMYPGVRGLGV